MVNGYSSFLLSELAAGRQPAGDSLREGLAEIDAAGRRLAEQMRRLDLVAELAARAEFGDDATGDPGESWATRLATACRQRAADRSNDLTVEFSDGRPALDYRALESVVLELLANAIQSSRPGDAIRICGQTQRDRYLLKICDEGIGLPPEELQPAAGRILGQDSPGGFGLAVVQYILRQADGHLELDQSAPCATCLRVSLPKT